MFYIFNVKVYEFYSGDKKKISGSGKSEQEHVPRCFTL